MEAYAVFRGIVQGVGFRYTTLRLARRHNIKGWVRNRGDGSVELVAQGSKEDITDFIEDIKEEFRGYIHDYHLEYRQPQEIFQDFSIRF